MNSRVIVALLLFAICAGGVASALAQSTETGFLNRAVRVDGIEYKYQVYVPREFRRSIAWPVILALHGGGAHQLSDQRTQRAPGGDDRPFRAKRPAGSNRNRR